MPDERDLPTIKQIGFAADSIADEPMSDEEAEKWFERTVARNRERRIKREQIGGSDG
jgi:hypothetical protein